MEVSIKLKHAIGALRLSKTGERVAKTKIVVARMTKQFETERILPMVSTPLIR